MIIVDDEQYQIQLDEQNIEQFIKNKVTNCQLEIQRSKQKYSQSTKNQMDQHNHNQSSQNRRGCKNVISETSLLRQKVNESSTFYNVERTRQFDQTLLSQKSQCNIRQTFKNMNNTDFKNTHLNYLQRSFSQMNQNLQSQNNEQQISHSNLNNSNTYSIFENKNYKTFNNESQNSQKLKSLQEKKNQYVDNFNKLNLQNNNQFQYIQNNMNLQNLFYNEMYQQQQLMPDASQNIFNKYYEYELNNMKVIQNLIQEYQTVQEHNNLLTESVDRLKNGNQDYEQKLKSVMNGIEGCSTFTTQIDSIKDQILFENQRLKREIELLQKAIREGDSSHIVQQCQEQMEESRKQQEKEITDYQERLKNSDSLYLQQKTKLDKMKTLNSQMNVEISNLRNEKQMLIMKMGEFQNNYKAEDIVRFRETLMMQKEDLYLKEELIDRLKKELQKLYDRYMTLTIKYDRLVKQEMEVSVDLKKNSEQKNLIIQVRNDVSKDLQFQRCIYKETKNPDQDQVIRNLRILDQLGNHIYEEDMQKTKGQIKYQMCVLAKPSFQLLLDDKLKRMNYQNVYDNDEQNWKLFVTLRGIMDSKYNEILLNHLNNDPVINISKFPEFVYSWLGCFSIDSQTRELGILDKRDIKPEEIRINFLFNLNNEKYNKIWEIQFFRDFLSEKCEIDELYFVLTIRHRIFKGPQLSIQKSKYDYFSYITVQQMSEIVKDILKKYGIQQQSFVVEKVKEKAKTKGRMQMVDVYYLLAVLLEYYKNEKKIKCKIIKDLFLSYSNTSINQQYSVGFDDFMHFMEENFSDQSEIEKVQIYRDCWNLGSGKIGPEIFITAANEKNLFIKHISLNKQFNFPVILNYNRNIDPSNQDYEVLSTLFSTVSDNINYFQKLENYIEGLGNEQFLNDFQQNYTVILEKFQNQSQKMQDLNIFHIMNRFLAKLLQIYNIQVMNQISMDDFEENSYILLAKDFITSIIKQDKELNRQKKLTQIRNNLKLINFQKYSRKQINKFYSNLLGLLNKNKNKNKKHSKH